MHSPSVHNRVLWTFLGASIVIVVLLRWSSEEGVTASDFFAIGIAFVAVAGYAAYAWWASRHEKLPISQDQAGDNAYYIGLLLTFVSLGVALVKLVALIGTNQSETGPSAVGVERIAQLIPDFGIALASTVFGIGARLWLQQQRLSPAEASEKARQELERAVSDLTRTLRIATGSITTSTNTVRHGLAKQLEQAAYEQIETFEEAQELVREAANEMARGLTELSGNLAAANLALAGESLGIRDAEPAAALRELGDHARDAGAAVAELREQCAAVSNQAKELAVQVDSLEKRLSVLAPSEQAGRLGALTENATSMTQSLVDTIAKVDSKVSWADASLKESRESSMKIEAVSGHVANLVSEVELHVKSAKDTSTGVASSLKDVALHAQELEHGLQSVSENANHAFQTSEAAARKLDTQVGTAVQQLRTLENDLRTLQDELGNVRPEVKNVSDSVRELVPEKEIEQLKSALGEARGRINELAKQAEGGELAEEIFLRLQPHLRELIGKMNAQATSSPMNEAELKPISEIRESEQQPRSGWRRRLMRR